MKLDVLLTDGDYKNTYAILMALKEKDLKLEYCSIMKVV